MFKLKINIFQVSCLIIFLFCLQFEGLSQKGFQGTIIFGTTASQIDGDELVGYKKLGLTGGLKVSRDLSPRFSGNVELVYSQRGSRSKLFGSDSTSRETKLAYFELPIYLSIKDWYIESGSYYKLKGELGFSLANLLAASSEGNPYNADLFKPRDFSWLVGATYAFNEKWAFSARYTRSFNKFYEDPAISLGYLLGYFWALRIEYNI